VSCFRKYPSGL